MIPTAMNELSRLHNREFAPQRATFKPRHGTARRRAEIKTCVCVTANGLAWGGRPTGSAPRRAGQLGIPRNTPARFL